MLQSDLVLQKSPIDMSHDSLCNPIALAIDNQQSNSNSNALGGNSTSNSKGKSKRKRMESQAKDVGGHNPLARADTCPGEFGRKSCCSQRQEQG